MYRAFNIAVLFSVSALTMPFAHSQEIKVADFGVAANSTADATPGVLKAIQEAQSSHAKVLRFAAGRYEFWPDAARHGHYFISNHDAVDSRAVALPLEGFKGLTLDGGGATFVLHGDILPIDVIDSQDVTLQNFTIEYPASRFLISRVISSGPGAAQVQVMPGQTYSVGGGRVTLEAETWSNLATASLEFDPATMTLALDSRDNFKFSNVKVTQTGNDRLALTGIPTVPKPGNLFIMRDEQRPSPAIWVNESKNTFVHNVVVHSALGMAFIAQKSEDVHLDGFSVTLSPGRYLTTSADATHFSNCKGKILVENGMFENMLDDGINVHGSFLKVSKLLGPNSFELTWGHKQTFGFTFAEKGEHLEFDALRTLLPYAHAVVSGVTRTDDFHMVVTVDAALPPALRVGDLVDNMDWRPSAIFRHNTVRRIRSRAVLFSTTAGVLIENNTFEKLTGAAVLIPGEGRDWFESTPSRDVVIRHNRILDTNLGRLTSGAITIGPTIDKPASTDGYSHRNILIEDNDFALTSHRIIQALSVDGLVFRRNRITGSTDYPQSGPPVAFSFVHSRCVLIEGNKLLQPFAPANLTQDDSKLIRVDTIPGTTPAADWQANCGTFLP